MGNPNICVDNLLNDLDSQFLDLFISESFTSAMAISEASSSGTTLPSVLHHPLISTSRLVLKCQLFNLVRSLAHCSFHFFPCP